MDPEALRKKLRALLEEEPVSEEMLLELDGKYIRLLCAGFEPPRLMFVSLASALREGADLKDAETFVCFLKPSDELARFLPGELASPTGRFVWSGEEGKLAVSVFFGFFSFYSAPERTTYIWICPDKHSLDSFVSHPLHMELSWWAMRNGLTFLHSACVGAESKGVLISGAGGSGKSTLALSSLLSGLDLLSDDYLMVRREDVPRAVRLYSTAYMTDDTLKMLPELAGRVFWRCGERGKNLIDLMPFGKNVADSLPIRAVVIPRIAHAEKPVIRRSSDVRMLVPLLSSTSYQNRELGSREVFVSLMSLLKGLPACVFELSADTRLNALCLKGFLEEL